MFSAADRSLSLVKDEGAHGELLCQPLCATLPIPFVDDGSSRLARRIAQANALGATADAAIASRAGRDTINSASP